MHHRIPNSGETFAFSLLACALIIVQDVVQMQNKAPKGNDPFDPSTASHTELVTRYRQLDNLYHKVLEERNRLATRNDWLLNKVACIPNNKLDAVTKLVVLGISQEFVRLNAPHSQLTKVWYPNIADHCGLSVQTVNSSVSKLSKCHAIIKETKCEKQSRIRRTWVAFTPEFLINPALLFTDVEESNHGGKRVKRHKGCGGQIVNLCTACGQTHIPDSEVYYQEEGEPERNQELLTKLDAQIELTDKYYEASQIDDDVVDAMGGPEQALAASPREIAERMSTPIHIRQGLDDEDRAQVDEIMQQYKMKRGNDDN